MAGDTVSLGEILSVKGDAQNAFGSPAGGDATVLPFNKGIDYLNQTAEKLAEADKFKYLEFQKNLTNHYANFNTIDITGLSPADQKIIGDKYASVAKLNADNIDVIKNPNINPQKYAEIKKAEADLLRSIAASKMHKSYDDKTAEFTKANPNWYDINKPKVESSVNTPTDEWKPYTLDMPISYSPDAVGKLVTPIAEQKYAEAIALKGYITEEEGVRIKKEAWDAAWDAVHSTTDPAGRSLYKAAKEAYEKIPPEARGGSFEDWMKRTRDSMVPQDQVSKKTVTPDQLVINRERNALTASEGAKDRNAAMARVRAQLDANKKNIGVDDVGRLYNEELTGFKTGQFSNAALQNIYGDPSKVTLKTGTEIPDPNNPGQKITTSTEVQVPKKQIVSSFVDDQGRLVYKYIDYSQPKAPESGGGFWSRLSGGQSKTETIGGYEVRTSEPVEFKQARTDFYRIVGDDDAPKVADVAAKYRIKHKLGVNPEAESLTKHFFPAELNKNNNQPAPVEFKFIQGTTKKGAAANGEILFTNDEGKTWFDKNGKQQF